MVSVAFSDQYIYPLPEGHRFPIAKYQLVKEQLLYQGLISEDQLYNPGLCPPEIIMKVHTPEYWQSLESLSLPPKELRRVGLPLSRESLQRARNSVAGTLESALLALREGIGINIGGGTHHAYADRGEGFCFLNDLAVAARYMLDEQGLNQVLVVDLDVHQGNGTAAIFAGESRVFTFSMHGKDNYPLRKEASDLDVPLPTGTTNQEYLKLLEDNLQELFSQLKPGIVFFQAGVDVLETDKLGKLALTKAGCRQRDELVIDFCRKNDVPLVITMGGGYSHRLADVIDAHCNTISTALQKYS